jgi:hypothetical protein
MKRKHDNYLSSPIDHFPRVICGQQLLADATATATAIQGRGRSIQSLLGCFSWGMQETMEPLLPVVGTIYSDPTYLVASSVISSLCSNGRREDERDVGLELRPASRL